MTAMNESYVESEDHAFQNQVALNPHLNIERSATTKLYHQNKSIHANPSALSMSKLLSRNWTDPHDYLQLILTANVYDVAIESPLQTAQHLSSRLGNTLLLKREDLQPVFSFKLRGAYNRMLQLNDEERAKGVIACSAGNHAQGVALAAKKLGIEATIVMPLMTPPIKWKNVERLGAKVLLHGADFDEAKAECYRLSELDGRTAIHPYDDPFIIAGQGTIGVELLRQTRASEIDAIFICVGGGGLIAGIASYVKRLYPKIKIIGVEAADAAAMTESLMSGSRTNLQQVGPFADGAAVRFVGEETFRICRDLVDEMVLVSTDEICAAIKDVFLDTRSILEPAGALGVAGCKKYIQQKNWVGKTCVAISSGANMNFDRLRFVAERAELGEKREALFSVIIPEKPGSFKKLYETLRPTTVTEFSYRYSHPEKAHIYMSLSLNQRDVAVPQIIESLKREGMMATDASENEMAKAHGRYLIGGAKTSCMNERLFRFSFPERPGALGLFLDILPPDINVSLFHYRNDGGDVGKVFVGLQIPKNKEVEFTAFLAQLKYPCKEETNNPLSCIFRSG